MRPAATGFITIPLKIRLKSRGVVILWAVFARKHRNEKYSDNESADMRPPRDSALAGARRGKRGCAVEELGNEPEAQDEHRRDFDNLPEDENRQERQDAR